MFYMNSVLLEIMNKKIKKKNNFFFIYHPKKKRDMTLEMSVNIVYANMFKSNTLPR